MTQRYDDLNYKAAMLAARPTDYRQNAALAEYTRHARIVLVKIVSQSIAIGTMVSAGTWLVTESLAGSIGIFLLVAASTLSLLYFVNETVIKVGENAFQLHNETVKLWRPNGQAKNLDINNDGAVSQAELNAFREYTAKLHAGDIRPTQNAFRIWKSEPHLAPLGLTDRHWEAWQNLMREAIIDFEPDGSMLKPVRFMERKTSQGGGEKRFVNPAARRFDLDDILDTLEEKFMRSPVI